MIPVLTLLTAEVSLFLLEQDMMVNQSALEKVLVAKISQLEPTIRLETMVNRFLGRQLLMVSACLLEAISLLILRASHFLLVLTVMVTPFLQAKPLTEKI
jgi:hypothetical protein